MKALTEDDIKEKSLDFILNTGDIPKTLEDFQDALIKFYEWANLYEPHIDIGFTEWCANDYSPVSNHGEMLWWCVGKKEYYTTSELLVKYIEHNQKKV